jgi:hypothetical protein
MRQNPLNIGGAQALLVVAAIVLGSVSAFAGTPILGADCGAGAAIVGTSSDSAGKVMLGTDPGQTCTVTFGAPYTNAPACSATDETTGPRPLAVVSTQATAALNTTFNSWFSGDVIAYICVEY